MIVCNSNFGAARRGAARRGAAYRQIHDFKNIQIYRKSLKYAEKLEIFRICEKIRNKKLPALSWSHIGGLGQGNGGSDLGEGHGGQRSSFSPIVEEEHVSDTVRDWQSFDFSYAPNFRKNVKRHKSDNRLVRANDVMSCFVYRVIGWYVVRYFFEIVFSKEFRKILRH